MQIDNTQVIVLQEDPEKASVDVLVEGIKDHIHEPSLRGAIFGALNEAQEKGDRSIGFLTLGCCGNPLGATIVAKIMAQEVLRYLYSKNPGIEKIVFFVNDESREIFEKHVYAYLEHMTKTLQRGPYLTVDAIIEYEGGVVMIERSNPPLGWALPGGFVDYGESVEDAVHREVKEETHLDFKEIKQFKVYSKPGRDPRFHTVSVVFCGTGRGILQADSDAKGVRVFPFEALPDSIAFDHRKIIEEYKSK